jgi:hypothetical protein
VRLGALLLAVTATTAAHAVGTAPPRAQLVVTRGAGAEDCPDVTALASKVRAMTAADVASSAADMPRDTWVEVELSRVLFGYRATISARGLRHGTRTIDDVGSSCSSLADAVAITLVMLLDPEVAPEPPPRPPPAPAIATAPPTNPAARRAFIPGAEAAGGVSFAVLAHPAPMLELGVRAGVGARLGLVLGGGLVFPDRVDVAGGSVKLGLAYGYLRGSLSLLEHAGTLLAIVAGPTLGSLSGEGSDYDVPMPAHHLVWVAVAGGPELRAALSSWLTWSARLFMVAPLIHQGFRVDDGGKPTLAFETPPLGGMLTFGAVAEL